MIGLYLFAVDSVEVVDVVMVAREPISLEIVFELSSLANKRHSTASNGVNNTLRALPGWSTNEWERVHLVTSPLANRLTD